MRVSAKRALVGTVALVLVAWLALMIASVPKGPPDLVVVRRPGPESRFETRFPIMGTDARLEAAARTEGIARRAFAVAYQQLDGVNAQMSTYAPESEVSRLNRDGASGVMPLSVGTGTVLREAVRFSELTGGAFDVTYAPLRTLWREAQQSGELPSERSLAEALGRIGHGKLVLDEAGARFAVAGMEVDLGGIAKGYAIDLAAEAMVADGVTSGLVDVGGDLRFIGERGGGGPWRVQMRMPPEVDDQIVLRLAVGAVATSGDYARYFTIGDQRFSHIVDPRTGRPVATVPSVTVVAPTALEADALATAMSVMGAEEGVPLVESLPGVECYLMTRQPDGSISRSMSTGFGAFLED